MVYQIRSEVLWAKSASVVNPPQKKIAEENYQIQFGGLAKWGIIERGIVWLFLFSCDIQSYLYFAYVLHMYIT
jgi:hypothetical protein